MVARSVAGRWIGRYIPECQLESPTRNMFRISRFHALMNQVPRGAFDRVVSAHGADKHGKGFDRWNHLLAMVYAQLSGAASLRSVAAGFNAHASHHHHLDAGAVRRSTLADANARTNPAVFADLAHLLMARAHRKVRREGQELLSLLDSTSITLKGRGFDDWTFETCTRYTQGVKLHVLLAGQAPVFGPVTAANVPDVKAARTLPLQAQTRYVFDMGYCDYTWWKAISDADARFVTRFKSNAVLTIVAQNPLPAQAGGVSGASASSEPGTILADESVCFTHRRNRGGHLNPYQDPLRRIKVHREGKTPLVLATNDLTSPAQDIADHYKARWGVELFFKWIKQHLNLKCFLGRSENAVKIQILTALIAYLLVFLKHQQQAKPESLWAFLAELRASLFQRPHIEAYRRDAYRRQQDRKQSLANQRQLFA